MFRPSRNASTLAPLVALFLSACSLLVDVDVKKLDESAVDVDIPPENCAACDDGIPCTNDVCESNGGCSHYPMAKLCDDGLDCTEDTCDLQLGCVSVERTDRCEFCFPGSRCDKAKGAREFGGCLGVAGRRNCSDNDACTTDSCSVLEMMCLSDVVDEDGDGVPASNAGGVSCGGADCDDTRANVYPGALETCNGRDDDCNGLIDDNCVPSPDHCAGAANIALNTQGVGVIEGLFGEVGDDFDVACGSAGTRDAVHKLVIPQNAPVDVVLSTDASSAEVVLAFGKTCDDAGFRLGCAKPMRTSGQTRLALHRYDPIAQGKELFILVDAKDKSETGAYRIQVKVTPAMPDVCVDSVFDHSGCGTVVGFLAAGGGRLVGSCQDQFLGRLATESMLRVAAMPSGRLDVTVRSEDFSPSLYALSGCGLFDTELACFNPPNQGAEARLSLDFAGGEQSAIVVIDSGSGAGGEAYTLTCGL